MIPIRQKALRQLMPKGGFTTNGDTVTIKEHGIAQGYSVPTEEEIQAAIAQLESLDYQKKRQAEYLAMGEQMDAILKGFQQMRDDGTALHPDLEAVVTHWEDVKARNPKPEAEV